MLIIAFLLSHHQVFVDSPALRYNRALQVVRCDCSCSTTLQRSIRPTAGSGMYAMKKKFSTAVMSEVSQCNALPRRDTRTFSSCVSSYYQYITCIYRFSNLSRAILQRFCPHPPYLMFSYRRSWKCSRESVNLSPAVHKTESFGRDNTT